MLSSVQVHLKTIGWPCSKESMISMLLENGMNHRWPPPPLPLPGKKIKQHNIMKTDQINKQGFLIHSCRCVGNTQEASVHKMNKMNNIKRAGVLKLAKYFLNSSCSSFMQLRQTYSTYLMEMWQTPPLTFAQVLVSINHTSENIQTCCCPLPFLATLEQKWNSTNILYDSVIGQNYCGLL